MTKSIIATLLAGTVALSACTTHGGDRAATNLVPIVSGISVAPGAVAGAAIGGVGNAVWADRNNDGFVDGYVQNGNYYSGTPQGYDPTLRRVLTGTVAGAALGAVAGAVIPGVSTLTGAVVGAAVGGLAGAVWADNNGDGRADGYVRYGQYYPGVPGDPSVRQNIPVAIPPPQPAPISAPARGERG